jgi:hypothetical protein
MAKDTPRTQPFCAPREPPWAGQIRNDTFAQCLVPYMLEGLEEE